MSILNRTFHPDEANQAFTTGRLLETGTYSYNPQDHHGPTLYYAAATLQKAAGHNSTATLDPTLLRCTPLLFAVLALVFGALAVRKITGRLWHGLLFALLLGTSPLFVFFATDFIQEMLLAAFTMMMLWSALGKLKSLKVEKFKSSALDVDRNSTSQPSTLNSQPSKLKPGTWALLFGIAAGLAFATKETAILTFAAAGLAGLPFLWCVRKDLRLETRDETLSILGFALTAALFYSSFGTSWQGVYNAFIAAPLSYIHRAAGDAASQGAAAHVHPWWQYLYWMFGVNWRFTAIPLLAAFAVTFRPRSFLHLYTIVLLLIYSFIPYKTPWCALQIVLPLAIAPCTFLPIIGGGVRNRIAVVLITLSIGLNIVGVLTINRDPDSKDIPYNYASASPQVQDLAALIIDKLASSQSRGFSYGNTDSPSKIEGVAAGRGSMTGDGIIPPRPFGALPLSQGESSTCHPQLFDITEKSDSLTVGQFDGSDTNQPPNYQTTKPSNFFIAVALPPEDTWPLPFYLRSINDKVGYWTQFGELEALAGLGRKPAVVVVPAEEGHLVQPLFPHLKNTKRFEMRPRVRVRAFW